MTAIDELCQLLDERNEEYERWGNSGCLSYHEWVGWYFNLADRAYFYEYSDGSTKLVTYRYVYNPTPEQAIAATLGGGMLTADDARDLIERHSDASGGNGRDFHNGSYVAIADELNATLGHSSNCTNGERTNAACKPITYDNGYSTDHLEPGEYHEFWEPACACGNCGELIPMRKFCPNCGSRLEVDA